jgi:broad specificity phosphatase PhoE
MSLIVLVRHGEPRVVGEDQDHWPLSTEGRERARILSEDPIWESVERFLTSSEHKAEETARVIAEARDLPLEVREDLREVRRPWEAKDYEDKIRAFLKGEPPVGWETRTSAETRFERVVEEVRHGGVDTGIVSHALLLTLFLARVSSAEPAFWLHHSIGFAEYAVYDMDAKVIRRGFRGSAAEL